MLEGRGNGAVDGGREKGLTSRYIHCRWERWREGEMVLWMEGGRRADLEVHPLSLGALEGRGNGAVDGGRGKGLTSGYIHCRWERWREGEMGLWMEGGRRGLTSRYIHCHWERWREGEMVLWMEGGRRADIEVHPLSLGALEGRGNGTVDGGREKGLTSGYIHCHWECCREGEMGLWMEGGRRG